ncbi:uncharacterized protein BP5553_01930 [Venustampulla echinocandica]|uniref:Zinc finger PHD-type domain-containing protein n=1 Tax=Venustampulla echinocandica TaxID=2656787 RepID=A0A370U2F8_9HELO|nr:uncharacterized protein BP5553_01930 [Venustampulla echinocandica]RDL41951.1 hypothetical protein BP5553_01930 [Venustampulla echinocandica]
MVSSRKRGRQEMEAVEPSKPAERSLLDRVRNMWEFANVVQYIYIFGRALKIDENLDIEDLEMECIKPYSTVLPEIGLALLKFVSSHRGLTPELFDEYTRRQYVAKAPHRNLYGTEEVPAKFDDFDIFTKIRVLQQLTQWTMVNPDRIRERMEEHKDSEQTIWRIEPFGWDSEDRSYFALDDNRLYRRTDPPPPKPPTAKPKKNSKKAKAAVRASKRRRVSEAVESEAEVADESAIGDRANDEKEDDGFGGMIWECVAITLDELSAFIATLEKTRDPNEKTLRTRLVEELLPLLEKQEESRKRKAAQKERELLNLEKLATAKRSSRIASKMEHQKQEEGAREAERKRQAELALAKKEQEKWLKLEKERESRMQTREQRLKEREARRILHEEELANLSEDSKKLEVGAGRLSERHLKAEIEKKKQALEELAEEEDWIFDCICGAYGQIDDGTHSIACDKCNIWQHSKCVGVSQAEADRDDFHFICKTCQRRAIDAERAKTHPPIKIKLNRPGSSSSPLPPRDNSIPVVTTAPLANGGTHSMQQSTPRMATWQPTPTVPPQYAHQTALKNTAAQSELSQTNGHQALSQGSDRGNSSVPLPASVARLSQGASTAEYSGPSPLQAPGQGKASPSYESTRPPSAHAFASPHPNSPTNLPPPGQPQVYTFVNGNGTNYNTGTPGQPVATPSKMQGTPTPAGNPHGVLQNYTANGPRPVSSDGAVARSSPFSGAPMLTPINHTNNLSNPPSSPIQHATPNLHVWRPSVSSSPHFTPSSVQGDATQGGSHTSPLPPAITGMSPTKHSPPRPTTSNGTLGSATPSVLPPVASLSPSFQSQNLTPPVKSSEPGRNRPNGQAASP